MKKYNKKELGDYQTPIYFTEIVCDYLKNDLKVSPDIIIEPTCGIGNFLKTCSQYFSYNEMYGIDIDENKLNQVDSSIPNLRLINEDIFTYKFNIDKNDSFLIIGNPPWITNTELSKIDSDNLPEKSNYKNEPAINAMMGDSNFDISESIIFKIIEEFKDTTSTIAFLCKTTVSRNIFRELIEKEIPYSFIRQLNFNSAKIFKIDVDACLFIIQFGEKVLSDKVCEVSDLLNPSKTLCRFGYISDKFYSNIDDVEDIDGECVFEWRQGVKHDCSGVMELTCKDNILFNKNGEEVNIENTLVYPLLKSSNLKRAIVKDTQKYVIITQKKVKQDTSYIKDEAPKTWKYLTENREYFEKRKSSIYRNASQFSIFGIGEYSFKKYKVAISGFYKNPIFSLVWAEKPVMLDDTCYFLSFDEFDGAYITMLILNSHLVRKFLKSIAFLDAKRPYTKNVLKRIDIAKCLNLLSLDDLIRTERELELNDYITHEKFVEYVHFINNL